MTLQNGVLKFASKEHLHDVMDELAEKENLENWYPNHEFVSLLKRQKSIPKHEYDKIGETGEFGELNDVLTFRGEGDEKILTEIIKTPNFAALLNSKSYLILGDSAYHVGANEVTSFYIGDDSNKLSSFLERKNIPGTHISMIKRMPSSNAKVLGEYQHTVDKRRIYAENNVISFGGIGGVREVFVEYLKKNWIGWSRTEADYLSLIFTATTLPYGGTSLYRKIEGWNVEIIGANMTSDQWGV